MNVSERFLKYVKIDTESCPSSKSTPSTSKQLDLAKLLVSEMKEMGIQDVVLSDGGIVYGTIPGNLDNTPTIGFIAHMDTSPDLTGKNVNPKTISNYDGKDIILNESLNIILSPSEFNSLTKQVGDDLIVTDGTTLLGGDDKAGIAEILTMAEYIINNDVKHGNIKIAFTPDEEVGRGTENFDTEFFGCDFAYTVDGGMVDSIDYENFNAASCNVTVNGKGIHPGSAKLKMINSLLIAMEFQNLLPVFDNPAYTENYEGFNHLTNMHGNVDQTTMEYIIRNHDEALLEKQKNDFINAANFLNNKYGYEIIKLDINDTYANMRKIIETDLRVIDRAVNAMKNIGLTPRSSGIRGGTDGAMLTYAGLLCPNLGTGSYNCHGRYEYVSINEMEQMVQLLIEIVKCNED